MVKYHISPKTQNPNICKAKSKCPLGEAEPHFSTKEDARDYVEQKAKEENYSFGSLSKRAAAAAKDPVLETLAEKAAGIKDCHDAEDLVLKALQEDFPEARAIDSIAKPDYYDDVLIAVPTWGMNENGNPKLTESFYRASVYSGYYEPAEFLSCSPMERKTAPVINTSYYSLDSTKEYPEVNKTLRELRKLYDPEAKYSERGVVDKEGEVYGGSSFEKTYERKDGSKIYCFPVSAIGDRSFGDKPFPVAVPDIFTENGERQNARKMDQGYVIYDTRSNEGVLMKFQSGSEDWDQSCSYELGRTGLRPSTNARWASYAPGGLYLLKGTGETIDTPYYEARNTN